MRAAVPLAAESLVVMALDEVAYSLGVWQGVTERTLGPILPKVRDLPGWLPRITWRRDR
jgi:hypothetical protein